jgi:iron complex transport system substrate-binding protein
MRRAVVVLATLAALAGCGSDDQPPPGGEAPAGGEQAFPARVEHKYGTTTVPAKPKRIVAVGLTEQDTILALGYKPVATSEWYGDQPYAVWPWARAALGDSTPAVLHTDDGFDFEGIAALRPDLILGVNSGMQEEDYEKLSRLAPTIAPGKGSTLYFSKWDQQVELIARALGKPREGRTLVRDIKAAYAKAAAAHPEWRGKTATFAQNGFYNGLIYAYQAGLSTDFLTMLGFEINPKLTPLVKKEGEQVGVSEERLDVLDADVIVFATEQPSDVAALKKVPTFPKLDAVADHRAVYTDATLAGAMYFISPLSLPYVLDLLVPQLEAAVAGRAPGRIADSPGS